MNDEPLCLNCNDTGIMQNGEKCLYCEPVSRHTTNAREILVTSHPINSTFTAWCQKRGVKPTLRKAREFKVAFPQLFITTANAV